ncbi:gliding motility-associated C-terminal domain-containing protein [Muricauda sp. ANG21]|uniref:gliding motility-associated C-terminal domain-containing protein n=1 Tax=Allomuricauda sp. ANG21 TaxID=3042468 RepID=UPI003451BA7B
MKQLSLNFLLLMTFYGLAQEGVHNMGMMRIYAEEGLGLHTNLVNNGIFDGNLGLIGFYSDGALSISGNFVPYLYDLEVLAPNNLHLEVSVSVENNHNFILGNITTPRNNSFTSLSYQSNAFYVGAGNISKVDGYVNMHGQQNFIFPVGDTEQLRPLVLHSLDINQVALCAYYFEDPNRATLGPEPFNTNAKAPSIANISTREFWHFQGTEPTTVQISWNPRSMMNLLTNDANKIVLVGWHRSTHQWENLGGGPTGDLAQGFVVSDVFDPNDYEVITFGTSNDPEFIVDLPNYLLTPNGDGINDVLEIPELELFPNNHMRIFDRYGLLVFEHTHYTNEFNGYATEGDVVISRNRGLPSGVYFYVVTLDDHGYEYQGFFYLDND